MAKIQSSSELTEITTNNIDSKEISTGLPVEHRNPYPPPNPLLGGVTKEVGFEWMNGQVTGCSESPVKPTKGG
ncbi:MAG: hypothetical protein F6K10_12710 [Moorea sp. SIO2B7]|nr:hypothetical protein [Moorena sp. SIO2B7]